MPEDSGSRRRSLSSLPAIAWEEMVEARLAIFEREIRETRGEVADLEARMIKAHTVIEQRIHEVKNSTDRLVTDTDRLVTVTDRLVNDMGKNPDKFGVGGEGLLRSVDILVRRSELAEQERERRAQGEREAAAVRDRARARGQWVIATCLALISVSVAVSAQVLKSCAPTVASVEESPMIPPWSGNEEKEKMP